MDFYQYSCDAHGTPIRFKVLLVARGFSQIVDIDYHETFSRALRIMSLCLLLALSTNLTLEVHHVYIETTFLHGDLEETICMEQPKMMENDKYPDYVCKLHKFLLNANLTQFYSELNLHVQKKKSELFIILGVTWMTCP